MNNDKRKITIEKTDEYTTKTSINIGSGYKKKASVARYETEIPLKDASPEALKKLLTVLSTNNKIKPEDIEEEIFRWLRSIDIPEDDLKPKPIPKAHPNAKLIEQSMHRVPKVLEEKYLPINGMISATRCLRRTEQIKLTLSNGNYELAFELAMDLVAEYAGFVYSIYEGDINKGQSKAGQNFKLTPEQYEKAFLYFEEKYESKGKKQKESCWEKTIEYVGKEFKEPIGYKTLRDNYKKWSEKKY